MIRAISGRPSRPILAGLLALGLAAGVVSATPLASFAANPALDVDLSSSLGAVTHGASGALYGLSENGTPPASDLAGLNMQTIGQMAPDGTQHPDGDALKVGPEFYAAGGKNVMIYMQDFYPTWPYTKVPIASYASVVTTEVNKVDAAPNASKYIYVPFNEPDWIWYGPSGTNLTNFLNDWKTIFQTIRAINPNAQIAGPNFESYNSAAYKSFLSFAKANNVLPNLITWHELDSTFYSAWYTQYNDFLASESSLGISPIPININEYGQTSEMGIPGDMLQYIARFDASRVSGDMASWWAGEYLGRLLNTAGDKTSGWYLYDWYGQLNGTSMKVTPPSLNGSGTLQGTASLASDKNSADIIVGGSGTNDVKISGLSSTTLVWYTNKVRVTVSTLANSGDSASSGSTVSSATHYVTLASDGTITVTIPNMAAANAYLIQLG